MNVVNIATERIYESLPHYQKIRMFYINNVYKMTALFFPASCLKINILNLFRNMLTNTGEILEPIDSPSFCLCYY